MDLMLILRLPGPAAHSFCEAVPPAGCLDTRNSLLLPSLTWRYIRVLNWRAVGAMQRQEAQRLGFVLKHLQLVPAWIPGDQRAVDWSKHHIVNLIHLCRVDRAATDQPRVT